jgi:formiminoglutamase
MVSVKEMSQLSKWCLIGIPDQQGVINIGGRIGTASAPKVFRQVFKRFKGKKPVYESCGLDADVPNISTDIENNHRQAADAIKNAHQIYDRSVVIGGGHDHGHSHLRGLSAYINLSSKKKLKLGCINIDAHFDVREPSPKISSGCPFFLSIEQKVIEPARFVEFGIQTHCNAPELWDFIKTKKIKTHLFSSLRGGKAVKVFSQLIKSLSSKCDVIAISLDMDAIQASDAPGVSAPQSEGFTSSEIIEMMEIAGKNKKVKSLGIFELCPEHDENQKTTRLAATAAYHFIEAGLPASL